jgi:hypothetical protein
MTPETIIGVAVSAVIFVLLAYRVFQALRESRVPDDFVGEHMSHETGEDK